MVKRQRSSIFWKLLPYVVLQSAASETGQEAEPHPGRFTIPSHVPTSRPAAKAFFKASFLMPHIFALSSRIID